MKRALVLGLSAGLVLAAAACGRLLPFGSDDDEAPPPPSAGDDAAGDERSAEGGSDGGAPTQEAAVANDGGFVCVPSKQCSDGPDECCSQQRGSGCTMKCEIFCCL